MAELTPSTDITKNQYLTSKRHCQEKALKPLQGILPPTPDITSHVDILAASNAMTTTLIAPATNTIPTSDIVHTTHTKILSDMSHFEKKIHLLK